MAKIMFPCGHENEVDFVGKGRHIACSTCGIWASVDKIVEHRVVYVASPSNYSPPTMGPLS